MIEEALAFVRQSLDRYLTLQFDLPESIVVLNSLLEQDGSVSLKNQNKIVISLINLDSESSRQFYGGQSSKQQTSTRYNPAMRFNLITLFASSFDDYEESLRFLNATIRFFQANSSLNAFNSPDIPSSLDKLQFEVENLDFYGTHNLWSAMGAKYIPSVIYRIRHVDVQANEIQSTARDIADVDAKVSV